MTLCLRARLFVFRGPSSEGTARLARPIASVELEQNVPAKDDLGSFGQRHAVPPACIGASEHDPVEQSVQQTATLRQLECRPSLEQVAVSQLTRQRTLGAQLG